MYNGGVAYAVVSGIQGGEQEQADRFVGPTVA